MGFLGFGVQSCGAAGLRVSPPLLIPPSSARLCSSAPLLLSPPLSSSLLLSPPLFGEKKKDTLLALDSLSGLASVLPLVFLSSEDFIFLIPFSSSSSSFRSSRRFQHVGQILKIP